MMGMRLVRRCDYYIMRYYCNSFLCTVTSFIQFWISLNAIPGRVVLASSMLVALLNVSEAAYAEMPVDYMTAMFFWMWGCQLMMYLSLVELGMTCAWSYWARDKRAAQLAGVVSSWSSY